MTKRIQLGEPCYMPLDNIWRVVKEGSILDVADNFALPRGAVVLSESAGSLGAHGKPTSVRNIKIQA